MIFDIDRTGKAPGDFVTVRAHDFTKASAKAFENKIRSAYHSGQKVVPVIIDSNGGDVHAVLSMLETIRSYEAHDGTVLTYVKGRAKSAALALTSFGTTGYRFAAPTSYLMFHQANGQLPRGKMKSLRESLEYGEDLNRILMEEMARECGQEDDYFKRLVERQGNVNNYMRPQKAAEHGLLDHICRPKLEVHADGEFKVVKA